MRFRAPKGGKGWARLSTKIADAMRSILFDFALKAQYSESSVRVYRSSRSNQYKKTTIIRKVAEKLGIGGIKCYRSLEGYPAGVNCRFDF
ncbi:Hypothetical predicted protein [Cloeon dipterum]|uniref:Uncharacterized protein n=1 Tax=Cloeon dipterum TaxID=197152 RepID=A0A8S1DAP5_9INSE|nr:Hypothetical predicted protein [Cloeon dipterum]